ncbi:hypothetical protein L9F63_021158, partial [Diploptera punctata]
MNESLDGQALEITFEFEGPREFSAVHLHASNLLSREFQVFSEARIFFSLDGERYQQTPLYFKPQTPSDEGGAARNVTIPLQNRVGRYVRLELDFASRWLLLSEIYFDSAISITKFGVDTRRFALNCGGHLQWRVLLCVFPAIIQYGG